MDNQKFDLWALVELMGHQKIAGRCTEVPLAGTNMLRVDVPETSKKPAFTKFFGGSSIYAINPIDEEAARLLAEKMEAEPVSSYSISELVKKHNALLLTEQAKQSPSTDWNHDDEEDEYGN